MYFKHTHTQSVCFCFYMLSYLSHIIHYSISTRAFKFFLQKSLCVKYQIAFEKCCSLCFILLTTAVECAAIIAEN